MSDMEALREQWQRIIAIAASYNLDTSSLTAALSSMGDFVVTVPMVGGFNTGKSSLVNRLLESEVLPTGIIAQTAVPTEILWGAEKMFVLTQETGRRKISARNFVQAPVDMSNVKVMQLLYDHPFLKEIESVRLVDMPGLDAISPVDEALVRQYLMDSMAYILVFAADEPVVKESIALFLAQLRLREIPVYAIVTKTDKVTPETLQRAVRFLTKQLPLQLGLAKIPLVTVCAKDNGNVEPLRQILRELQDTAQDLCLHQYKTLLRQYCRKLSGYLQLRMEAKILAASALEGRLAVLERSLEEFSRLQQQKEREHHQQLEGAYQALAERLRRGLEVMHEPVSVMVLARRDCGAYIDQVMSALLAGAVLSHFLPILLQYRKNLAAISDLQIMGENVSYEDVPMDPAETEAYRERVLRTVLDTYPGCREALNKLEETCHRLPKSSAHPLGVQSLVQQILLPELVAVAENCLRESMAKCGQILTEQAVEQVTQDLAVRRLALEDIRQEKKAQDAHIRHSKELLCADKSAVDSVMDDLEG